MLSTDALARHEDAMRTAVSRSTHLRSVRDQVEDQRTLLRTSLHTAHRSMASLRRRRDDVVTDMTLPRSQRDSVAARDLWRLHVTYARGRGPIDLEQLVLAYLPRTDREARSMTHRPSDIEDRTQVAREALVLALQRFDPARSVPFEVFLDATVGGQLRKDVRDRGWMVRVPRRVHELYPAIRTANERLSQELGRTPTPAEIATDLGTDVDDVLLALSTHDARTHRSLDAMLRDTAAGFDVGEVAKPMSRVDDVDALRRALAVLTETDRKLVHDYFILGKTQQQIADSVDRSQMHVSRQLRRVLRLLAARVDGD